MTDEEVHAISAVLGKNENIAELNLQGNLITDDGCRSLSCVLSLAQYLKYVDLRRNRITFIGMKSILEGLERNDRVGHIQVYAFGRIEAIGRTKSNNCEDKNESFSSIICIVDVRENALPVDLEMMKEAFSGLSNICFQETCIQCSDTPTKAKKRTPRSKQKSETVSLVSSQHKLFVSIANYSSF